MPEQINPVSMAEARALVSEQLLNRTSKITKVAPASVNDGVVTGVAKMFQRGAKDLAIINALLFPDTADGDFLDASLLNFGIAPRFGALGSSTYIYLVGTPGTTYIAGTQTFNGSNGINFELVNDTIIPSFGYTFALITSQSTGANTNVAPLTISNVTPAPPGHQYCANLFMATGGQDFESDQLLQQRAAKGANILAKGTIAALEQAFMLINQNVFRVYTLGYNSLTQIVLGIVTVNGTDLSPSELSILQTQGGQFLGLSELRPDFVQGYGLILQNIQWYPIDVSFRVKLLAGADPDTARIAIQTGMQNILNYQTLDTGVPVDVFRLAEVADQAPGVDYLLDNYFTPSANIIVPPAQLPRIRGFLMMDQDGNIIGNFSGTLNPFFFPSNPDFAFQASVLRTIS